MNVISELLLQSHKPIPIGEVCKVHHVTLDEILEVTEGKYQEYLNLITFNKNRMNNPEFNDYSDYTILIQMCLHDEGIKKSVLNAIEFFLRETVFLHENGFFYLGDESGCRVIDEDVFAQIQLIVKKQNLLSEEEAKPPNPANDKAAELIRKLEEQKRKLAQQNKNEQLSLSDIVSIVANYSNDISILEVWKLTVYQLYVSYIRIIMMDDYKVKSNMLPHVSDHKSLDMKHFARKIEI